MRLFDQRFHSAQPWGIDGLLIPSAVVLRCLSRCWAFAVLAALFAAQNSTAGMMQPVRSLLRDPVGPRGGVMLLPLVHEDDQPIGQGDITLLDDQGEAVSARVVRVGADTAGRYRGWTADPRNLHVELATGEQSFEAGRYFLLVRTPDDAKGRWQLNEQIIRPRWRDLPERKPGESSGTLEAVASPARPSADCPFSWWRWVVLAEGLGAQPPPLDRFDEANRLLAEHYSNLWRIALERLGSVSPEHAAALRDTLTRTCMDGDVTFAAWPADPAALHRVLTRLLDDSIDNDALLTAVEQWVSQWARPMLWPERVSPDAIDLAIVNPAADAVVARLFWIGDDEVPLAVELPPGRVTRVRIDRQRSRRPGTEPLAIHIEVDEWSRTVDVGRASRVVQPPGLVFPPLRPPLTLAQLQMAISPQDIQPAVPATLVQLRKLRGRWELFFECARPRSSQQESDAASDQSNGDVRTLDDARRREGVILTIGANDEKPAVLFVPESGWHRIFQGENDGTLQVHRESYDERWYCRVVLPEQWLAATLDDDRTNIGVARTHSGADVVSPGPLLMPPWITQPGTVAVDMTNWADLPGNGP